MKDWKVTPEQFAQFQDKKKQEQTKGQPYKVKGSIGLAMQQTLNNALSSRGPASTPGANVAQTPDGFGRTM